MSNTDRPAPTAPQAASPAAGGAPQPDAARPKPVLTASQAKRANQTLKGMVISSLLTVAVVVPVIALNPTSTAETYERHVDVAAVAGQAAAVAGFDPVAPELPAGWSANFARWVSGTADGVDYWETGFVTPDGAFVWLRQAAEPNPTWIAHHAEDAAPAGPATLGGAVWDTLEGPEETTYVHAGERSTVLLTTDASAAETETAARAVLAELP